MVVCMCVCVSLYVCKNRLQKKTDLDEVACCGCVCVKIGYRKRQTLMRWLVVVVCVCVCVCENRLQKKTDLDEVACCGCVDWLCRSGSGNTASNHRLTVFLLEMEKGEAWCDR